MIVAIHAIENTYNGLHGIESYHIFEVENIQEAERLASEESMEVMHAYENIIEDFYQNAEDEGLEEGSPEFDEYIDECIQENIDYEIWEVIDCYDTIEQMEEDFRNYDDEFIKEHCRELE